MMSYLLIGNSYLTFVVMIVLTDNILLYFRLVWCIFITLFDCFVQCPAILHQSYLNMRYAHLFCPVSPPRRVVPIIGSAVWGWRELARRYGGGPDMAWQFHCNKWNTLLHLKILFPVFVGRSHQHFFPTTFLGSTGLWRRISGTSNWCFTVLYYKIP